MQYAPKKKPPYTKWEVLLILLIAGTIASLLLSGCGSKREEAQHVERQDQTTIRTTTIAEVSKPTPAGTLAVVESTKTTTYTEQVAQGISDSKLTSTVTLQAPELGKIAGAIGGLACPGFGGAISGLFSWLTGSPEGAATGLAGAGVLSALVKRGIGGELKLRQKDRHLRAIVQGNSDFMQAHPEQAEKLKDAQRAAQVDPTIKATVKQIRVDGGLV